MRVGFVSTYPPMRCAIGLYSRLLARALIERFDDVSIVVAAEHGADVERKGRLDASPVYSRNDDYVDDVCRALESARVDVAHFQYAPDLFGEDGRLPTLLGRLQSRGIRTVVTLHTVYDERPARRLVYGRSSGDFHRAVGGTSDRVVVHHRDGMAGKLEEQGLDAKAIAVIPHGTTLLDLPDQAESRRALSLPEGLLLTFFGFIHLQKNVHTIVEAFLRIADEVPAASLLVSGMPWGDRWYNHLYVQTIRARVAAKRRLHRVLLRYEYASPDDVPRILAASDVMLLPHHQKYGSASGVFHQAIGSRRALLCARGPKFEDALLIFRDHPELCVPSRSVSGWARAMKRIIVDDELRTASRDLASNYARETTWPRVAERHHELYTSLLTA